MTGSFNLENYATVAQRIEEFYKEHPEGTIRTELAAVDGAEVVFKATVFRTVEEAKAGVGTTGFAREIEGKSPVNRTSHYENCESSAIGRALANLGYATSAHRPSRQEMLKSARMQQEHDEMLDYIKQVGVGAAADATVTVGGDSLNLRQYVRDNWKAAGEQYLRARQLVEVLERSVGTPFESHVA